MGKNWIYHFVAFIVVAIWGSTFVFTKMLLQAGLSPAQIFTLRFIIAYVLLLAYQLFARFSSLASHRYDSSVTRFSPAFSLFCTSWRDELLMVALGITGGSVYFLAENAAMLYTTATNTSLIVCMCPLFTMLLVALFYRHSERFSPLQVLGSVMACAGMSVVVLNGHFVLHLSPLGDVLAFCACLCWAFYSLLLKAVSGRYGSLFVTRKVFFYGLLTILPYYIWVPGFPSFGVLSSPPVLWNLLFLGVVASMVCFLVWNWVIKKLGAVAVTNWVYFNPLTTTLFAAWLLGEHVTPWQMVGTVLILSGMYLCSPRSTAGVARYSRRGRQRS